MAPARHLAFVPAFILSSLPPKTLSQSPLFKGSGYAVYSDRRSSIIISLPLTLWDSPQRRQPAGPRANLNHKPPSVLIMIMCLLFHFPSKRGASLEKPPVLPWVSRPQTYQRVHPITGRPFNLFWWTVVLLKLNLMVVFNLINVLTLCLPLKEKKENKSNWMLFQKLIIPNMVKAVIWGHASKKQMQSFLKSPYTIIIFTRYCLHKCNSKWKIYFLYHYRSNLA